MAVAGFSVTSTESGSLASAPSGTTIRCLFLISLSNGPRMARVKLAGARQIEGQRLAARAVRRDEIGVGVAHAQELLAAFLASSRQAV